MHDIDIEVEVEGPQFLLRPRTPQGRAYVEAQLPGARRVGDAFTLSHARARRVMQQMLDGSLRLQFVRAPEAR